MGSSFNERGASRMVDHSCHIITSDRNGLRNPRARLRMKIVSGPVLLRKWLDQGALRVKSPIVILAAAFFPTRDSHRYSRVLQSR